MFVNTLELLNREKWDLVTSHENLAPKYFTEFPVLELIKYSWVMMQLLKPLAHLTSICFSAWIWNIADFVEMFSIFSPDFGM